MLDEDKQQTPLKMQGKDNQREGGTFQHSIKVPDLYRVAKKILKKYENKEGSLKTLVYKERYRNYKSIYGLLSKAVDNVATIKTAIALSDLLVEQPKFDPHLAQLFAAQLLAKGSINGNCKPILIFNEYSDKIRAAAEKGFKNVREKKNAGLPRYVRVNTLVGALSRVHLQLQKDGFVHQEYNLDETTYDDFLHLVNNLTYPYYLDDYHVPNLLVFPPGTEFWKNVLHKENVIMIQDKGSCLPVYLSSVEEGACVLDACAAPGNKTSLIAAKMNNRGKLIAVERDSERFQTMVKLLRRRQVTCAKTLHGDFLKIDPNKYSDVEYIFLDPSCSSSGTNVHEDEISTERLGKLATVQGALLSHALSFPSVKEVIYSTCSVYDEENEVVVGDALEKHTDFKLENLNAWKDIWKHFGGQKYNFGQRCLRTNTEIDRCAGFFVAKFVRKSSSKKSKTSESQDLDEDQVECANEETEVLTNLDSKKSKKKKRKAVSHDFEEHKVKEIDEGEDDDNESSNHSLEMLEMKTKGSICENSLGDFAEVEMDSECIKESKKKKKTSHCENVSEDVAEEEDGNECIKESKKKKKTSHCENVSEDVAEKEGANECTKKSKKKKRKTSESSNFEEKKNEVYGEDKTSSKTSQKKSKKKKISD